MDKCMVLGYYDKMEREEGTGQEEVRWWRTTRIGRQSQGHEQ